MTKIIEQIIVRDNKTQREFTYTTCEEKGLWYQIDSVHKTISITQLSFDSNRTIAFLFDYSIINIKWQSK